MGIPQFEDYIAICNLKARYCRCLDGKDWAGYAYLFTEGAELDTSGSGGSVISGRDELVASVRSALSDAVTVHQVHSPEISMTGPDSAEVTWAMQDRIVWPESKAASIGHTGLTGFGHYHEVCTKAGDGQWRIARSRLTRLHIEFDALAAPANG